MVKLSRNTSKYTLITLLAFYANTLSAAQAELTSQQLSASQPDPAKPFTLSLKDELLKSFATNKVEPAQTLPSEAVSSDLLEDQLAPPMDDIGPSDKLSHSVKPGHKALIEKANKAKKPPITVLSFLKPIQAMSISSGFGQRWGRVHEGIDIASDTGTPIYATEAGRVAYSGWKGGYGNFVSIDHDGGYSSRYGHAATLLVSSGQNVKKGQLIAKVGSTGNSTGPHLHFELMSNGVPQNPMALLNKDIIIAARKNNALQ